ncbi:MAG TPA: hypothetical protein VF171_04085, partial [Trueperaceae bacterium]
YHLWEAHARGVRAHAAFLALRNDLVTIRRYYRGLRKAEMLAGRHLTGFLHLGVAGRPGWALRAAREARAMLAQSPRRRVPDEVLQRIYPAFDGLTLLTLFSETNRRRVSWLLGRAGVDQVC